MSPNGRACAQHVRSPGFHIQHCKTKQNKTTQHNPHTWAESEMSGVIQNNTDKTTNIPSPVQLLLYISHSIYLYSSLSWFFFISALKSLIFLTSGFKYVEKKFTWRMLNQQVRSETDIDTTNRHTLIKELLSTQPCARPRCKQKGWILILAFVEDSRL